MPGNQELHEIGGRYGATPARLRERPHPGLPEDRTVLRTVVRERGATLAVGALVVTPGAVAVGDDVVDLGEAGAAV